MLAHARVLIRWATLSTLLAACAGTSDTATKATNDAATAAPEDSANDAATVALNDAATVVPNDAATVVPNDAATVVSNDAATVAPLEPRIPEPNGVCPAFVAGTQKIAHLETTIVAGPVGAAQGPLLIVWHGILVSGSEAIAMLPSSMREDIEAQGGLIISPHAPTDRDVDGTLALGLWDLSDLEYVDHVVGCAVRDHNIDPRRIYTMGCIAGGYMAGALAVRRSSYIAALAPSTGGLTTDRHALEEPRHAPAAFMMHGPDNDALVLQATQAASMLHDVLAPAGGFFVQCMHEVNVCGPSELLEDAWTFLQAHPFGVSPKPYAQGLPRDFPDYCAIVR
jgi:hypothetical protein